MDLNKMIYKDQKNNYNNFQIMKNLKKDLKKIQLI